MQPWHLSPHTMARSQGQFQVLSALVFPDKGALTVYLRLVKQKQALQVGNQLFIAAVNRKKVAVKARYIWSTRGCRTAIPVWTISKSGNSSKEAVGRTYLC